MLKRLMVPKTIQWIVKIFFIYLFIFTAFRIATVLFFKPAIIRWSELLPSFWLGLKYDLRWISFVLTPMCLLSLLTKLSPFYSERNKIAWSIYLGMLTLFVLFFFGADFGQFAYVNARLNADALIFAQDPKESLQMIWQSYPIIWILIALTGAVLIMVWMFKRLHVSVEEKNIDVHKFSFKKKWHFLALLILGWFMYGFFTVSPLNFYRAFRLNDEFKSNVALNPLQNFFTTLGFRKPNFSTQAATYYDTIKTVLNFEKTSDKNPYLRIVQPNNNSLESNPNIVLVICESFSMYKSSMSGNVLNSTPYFNSLSQQGIFFDRCFTPSFGTARGVFATITGIPDVQQSQFSTRNEAAIIQKTIINNFTDYEKFYFIGGRSQFNNFGGLIKNIQGVKIYEEGSYQSPIVNVWGISDKNLFLEANQVLKSQKKPFFAIIQTADNHRPYNIPEEDKDFVLRNISEEELRKNGFETLKEFNAFSYFDYCVNKFMEAAKKEKYFDNTVFAFVGDHGVEGNASAYYPAAWVDQRLADEHVPFLLYGPNLITPKLLHKTVSQIDVLPTIAGLIHQPYTNTTLGRDVLHDTSSSNYAFIMYHAPGWIGLVTDQYFYRKNLRIEKDELVTVTKSPLSLTPEALRQEKKRLSDLTSAYYETAQWMLVNNK